MDVAILESMNSQEPKSLHEPAPEDKLIAWGSVWVMASLLAGLFVALS